MHCHHHVNTIITKFLHLHLCNSCQMKVEMVLPSTLSFLLRSVTLVSDWRDTRVTARRRQNISTPKRPMKGKPEEGRKSQTRFKSRQHSFAPVKGFFWKDKCCPQPCSVFSSQCDGIICREVSVLADFFLMTTGRDILLTNSFRTSIFRVINFSWRGEAGGVSRAVAHLPFGYLALPIFWTFSASFCLPQKGISPVCSDPVHLQSLQNIVAQDLHLSSRSPDCQPHG